MTDKQKTMRQNLLLLLGGVVMAFALLEVGLRVIDPLGIHRMATLNIEFAEAVVAHERGYALPPGSHRFRGWTATIDPQHNRVVPATPQRDCQIVVLGDSVAFGYGVDDNETWINLLAAESNAQFINKALTGYDLNEILRSFNEEAADGYIYMMVGNDAFAAPTFRPGFERHSNAADLSWTLQPLYWLRYEFLRGTFTYRYILLNRQEPLGVGHGEVLDHDWYFEQVQPMMQRDDVLVLGFAGDDLTEQMHEKYNDVVLMPRWTSNISWMDGHADAVGNQQIADGAREPISAFVNQICAADA